VNPVTQERSSSVNFVNKLTFNIISCSEVEKEIDQEDDNKENWPREMSKTLAAIEAIPMRLTSG